jgi:hypothetical protein
VVVSGHEDDLRCAGCALRSIVALAHRFECGASCMVVRRGIQVRDWRPVHRTGLAAEPTVSAGVTGSSFSPSVCVPP